MSGMELKVARIRSKVKQIDLSRTTGIAANRLSMIENEYKDARPEEVAAICAALKIDASETVTA